MIPGGNWDFVPDDVQIVLLAGIAPKPEMLIAQLCVHDTYAASLCVASGIDVGPRTREVMVDNVINESLCDEWGRKNRGIERGISRTEVSGRFLNRWMYCWTRLSSSAITKLSRTLSRSSLVLAVMLYQHEQDGFRPASVCRHWPFPFLSYP